VLVTKDFIAHYIPISPLEKKDPMGLGILLLLFVRQFVCFRRLSDDLFIRAGRCATSFAGG